MASPEPPSRRPTPIRGGATPSSARSTPATPGLCGRERSHLVSFAGCRPSVREKSSVVPLENDGRSRLFFSSFPWRSPRPESDWRRIAADLSRKLDDASRTRDDATTEASRLKRAMAELERKLTRLEIHCRELKSAVGRSLYPSPVEGFAEAAEDAGAAVRRLSSALLELTGETDPALLLSMEALLSRTFYEDFELASFERGCGDRVIDPGMRKEENWAAAAALRELSWDDVLSRGTRHYSEMFSRFCDRKMAEVAGAGGGAWGRRGWPEPLLRAFFGAAKAVYLVHLLAWCGHPPAIIFRADAGQPYDPNYMLIGGGGGGCGGSGGEVKTMLAPGFFVGGSVVRCRVVLCRGRRRAGNCSNL